MASAGLIVSQSPSRAIRNALIVVRTGGRIVTTSLAAALANGEGATAASWREVEFWWEGESPPTDDGTDGDGRPETSAAGATPEQGRAARHTVTPCLPYSRPPQRPGYFLTKYNNPAGVDDVAYGDDDDEDEAEWRASLPTELITYHVYDDEPLGRGLGGCWMGRRALHASSFSVSMALRCYDHLVEFCIF